MLSRTVGNYALSCDLVNLYSPSMLREVSASPHGYESVALYSYIILYSKIDVTNKQTNKQTTNKQTNKQTNKMIPPLYDSLVSDKQLCCWLVNCMWASLSKLKGHKHTTARKALKVITMWV